MTVTMNPSHVSAPLSMYVIAVAVVWAVILCSVWFWDKVQFNNFALLCGGFFVGMLAMYIAVHLYMWH